MTRQLKRKYTVEIYREGCYFDSQDTWAVSEKQAINNVRHNILGDYVSQYDYANENGKLIDYTYEIQKEKEEQINIQW